MKMTSTFYPQDRQEWRDWLAKHYQSEKEVWLIYYKASTGLASIPYEVSVEEALCFGWVDSIIQKIDEQRYARKFTPRTNTMKWSDSNKRRMTRLIREGRMTEAGLAKIDDLSRLDAPPVEKPKELVIPPHIEQRLRENPVAWENFTNLPPSQRRIYIGWISDAKRAETVDRRLTEAIQRLEKNLPLGMK